VRGWRVAAALDSAGGRGLRHRLAVAAFVRFVVFVILGFGDFGTLGFCCYRYRVDSPPCCYRVDFVAKDVEVNAHTLTDSPPRVR
jgi:hypothetical protein